MKNTFLLLITFLCLGACESMSPSSTSNCGSNLNKAKDATITYRTKNKFEVSLDLKVNVKKKSEFRIKLDPKQGSDDANIKIIGKSGKLKNGNNTSFSWLDAEGKAGDFPNKTIVLCVPDVPAETTYKFDVEIAGIGTITTIDPRVNVE